MAQTEVEALVGPPLWQSWSYPQRQLGHCDLVWFKRDSVFYGCGSSSVDIAPKLSLQEVLGRLGTPDHVTFLYSFTKRHNYRQRVVSFKNGHVTSIYSEAYF